MKLCVLGGEGQNYQSNLVRVQGLKASALRFYDDCDIWHSKSSFWKRTQEEEHSVKVTIKSTEPLKQEVPQEVP